MYLHCLLLCAVTFPSVPSLRWHVRIQVQCPLQQQHCSSLNGHWWLLEKVCTGTTLCTCAATTGHRIVPPFCLALLIFACSSDATLHLVCNGSVVERVSPGAYCLCQGWRVMQCSVWYNMHLSRCCLFQGWSRGQIFSHLQQFAFLTYTHGQRTAPGWPRSVCCCSKVKVRWYVFARASLH